MFKKNLTQIVSSFAKTISQLENLAQRNGAAVEANTAAIDRLNQNNIELTDESVRANKIAENLRKLLE